MSVPARVNLYFPGQEWLSRRHCVLHVFCQHHRELIQWHRLTQGVCWSPRVLEEPVPESPGIFSPSPSGESLEPASASLTAHGQTDVPPIPFPPREPLGQA